ncbi:MAG: transglycosylase family protein [Actinomycetota bacterium]
MRRGIAIAVAVIALASQTGTASGYKTDPATVKRQIRAAWGGNDKRAIRVAKCESSLNPKALSPNGTYRGLWQFSLATWNEYDPPANDPIKVNAKKQTEVAYRLYLDRGWQPWPTCGASKSDARDSSLWGPQGTDARRR